jgi:hypothetical protein
MYFTGRTPFISTYLSIGFIVIVQLNYVIAPRIFRDKKGTL